MTILFMLEGKDRQATWEDAFRSVAPELDIRIWPELGNADDIEFAFVWRAIPGKLGKLNNLKCIASMGAGVDYILADDSLPQHIPVVRVVDRRLTLEMAQYIIHAVVHFTKHMSQYQQDQQTALWQPLPEIRDINVGVMGLGNMGLFAAQQLQTLGFNVIAWRASDKKQEDIECYHEQSALSSFLARAHILICTLPLTPQTKGILNKELFAHLPQGACLIHVGRGDHLVVEDLMAALDSGQLAEVYCDVFPIEPLPEDSPLWQQENLRITPHIASVTYPVSVAKSVVENYHRMQNGEVLLNLVDRQKGY